MKTTFVNLTPHEINIGVNAISASGLLARAEEHHEHIDTIDGINITRCKYGDVKLTNAKTHETSDFPEEVPGKYYIVSNIAAHMFPAGRNDILIPGDPIRDDAGKIIGCNGLCRL